MDKLGLVPDVLDKLPGFEVSVTYEGDVKVENGKKLTPTQVKDPPRVSYPADPEGWYTLIMTNLDAPSSVTRYREWHHWLVVNIPGDKVPEGEVLTEYVGAAPPKGSGEHRYVFVVYKQPKKMKFEEPKVAKELGLKERGRFSLRKFSKKYNLGHPIAFNAFQAEWDSYVPVLIEKISRI